MYRWEREPLPYLLVWWLLQCTYGSIPYMLTLTMYYSPRHSPRRSISHSTRPDECISAFFKLLKSISDSPLKISGARFRNSCTRSLTEWLVCLLNQYQPHMWMREKSWWERKHGEAHKTTIRVREEHNYYVWFLDWYGLGPAPETQRGVLLLVFGCTVETQMIAIGRGFGSEPPIDQPGQRMMLPWSESYVL